MVMCFKQVFRLTVLFTKIKQLIKRNKHQKRNLLVLNVLLQSEQLHKHSALSSTSILASSTRTVGCRNNSVPGCEMCDLACPCRARLSALGGGPCSARRWLSENRYLSKSFLPPQPPTPGPVSLNPLAKSEPWLSLAFICYYLSDAAPL